MCLHFFFSFRSSRGTPTPPRTRTINQRVQAAFSITISTLARGSGVRRVRVAAQSVERAASNLLNSPPFYLPHSLKVPGTGPHAA